MSSGGRDYFTEMCSGPEAGSYPRRIDFVYLSILGVRVILKMKEKVRRAGYREQGAGCRV